MESGEITHAFLTRNGRSFIMGANLIPLIRNFGIDANFTGDQHEIDDGYVTAGTHKVLWFDQMIQSAELESPIRFIN